MKRSNLILALVVFVLFSGVGSAQVAQEAEAAAVGRPDVPTLPCCKCLGGTGTAGPSLDLSTGQAPWKVNNGPAYPTATFPGWHTPTPPAKWVQSVNSPTAGNVPQGTYTYTLAFTIPRCVIPVNAVLKGSYWADNAGKIWLDSAAGTPCPGNKCFVNGASFSFPNIPPGSHTLKVQVQNDELVSGLLVEAKLIGECSKGP